MLNYPNIDPVIFSIGFLKVRWYGLMYVFGFAATYYLVLHQLKQLKWQDLSEKFDNLNLYLILGVILGGRLGYVIFYQPMYYLNHPFEIFATWQGGMSFHGGCIGVILAGWIFCRRNRLNFWKAGDLYVVTIPLGLGFGRLGNFINGELYGRTTEVPWGMIFPGGGPLPRHPSQIYEALLEGLLLFILLWSVRKKTWGKQKGKLWPHGAMIALFLIGYGIIRFFVEFFREPDAYLGEVLLHFTMGQVLSSFMILAGAVLWIWRARTKSEIPIKR